MIDPPTLPSSSRPSSVAARAARLRTDRHAREALTSVFIGLGVYGLGLLTGPLLARALGPGGRGDLASVVVPSTLFVWVICLGMPGAVIYYMNRYEPADMLRTVLGLCLLGGAPVALALGVLVPDYLNGHASITVPFLRFLLFEAVLGAVALCAVEVVRAGGAGITYNLLKNLNIVLNAFVIAALFVTGHLTLVAALWSHTITLVVSHLIAVSWVRTRGGTFQWPLARVLLRYGSRLTIGTMSNTLVSRLDQLVLVGLVRPAQLGIYAVAVSAANLTVPVGQGVAAALMPALRREGAQTVDGLVRRSVLLTAAVSTTIVIGLGLLAPFAIPAVFGEDFRGAVRPLLLLLPGQVCLDVSTVIKGSLAATGHPGKDSLIQVAGAAVTIALLPIGVSMHGVDGAAVVTSASYLTMLLVAGWFAVRVRGDDVAPDAT